MIMVLKMVILSKMMMVMIKVPIDMIMVLKIGIEQIEHCPYMIVMIVSKMMINDGDDHYSAQDDDVGDDQRCWGMQVGGQKQTPATPL